MFPREKKDVSISSLKKAYKKTIKEKFSDEKKFIKKVEFKIEEDEIGEPLAYISIYLKKDKVFGKEKMTEIANTLTLDILRTRTRKLKALPWPHINFFEAD